MKLSIIIPTYNREELLCRTIDSVLSEIRNSDYQEDCELIVVDQTKEHSSDVILFLDNKKNNSNFKYLYIENPNLPNARNVGLSYSEGDFILFLDDDVVLHEGLINTLIETYDKNKEISSVVGMDVLKNLSGSNIILESESRLKKIFKLLLTRLFCFNKASVITNFGLMLSNRGKSGEKYADSGKGCIMSFKKSLLLEIGEFDINYQGNALREESDVFIRIKRKRKMVLFNPAIKIDHIMENEGGCRAEKSEDYWQMFFNNQLYFYRKNFGFPNWYIKILLFANIRYLRRKKYDVDKMFVNAYYRSVNLLGR